MKLINVILLVLSTISAWAQPRAFFPATVHDFGPIEESDGPATCSFELVNVGTEPLSIINARATCGCTTPRYPRGVVAPGDTALIEVSFDPQARPGRFNKQVYVETNATPAKTRLDVKGVVIGTEATVSQRYPVDFGRLKLANPGVMLGDVVKGHMKTVYFDGYNRSADPMTIKMTDAPKWLDVIVSPDTIGAGEQATFIAYVNSTRCPLYGPAEGSVTFDIDGGAERFTLPVTVMLKEDFSDITPQKMAKSAVAAVTPRVELGEIDRAAGVVDASFEIANQGQSNLEIRRIYATDPGIEVEPPVQTTVKKGKSIKVNLKVDPAKCPGGLLNSQVTVITNDPMQPVQSTRVAALWR